MTFAELKQHYYQHAAVTPQWGRPKCFEYSDIVLHLPVLEYYASLCDRVTEFGVRDGHSTVALISGCKWRVESYDIEHTVIVNRLRGMPLPCQWSFGLLDTGSPEQESKVGETDLLFIDTLHTYEHVSKELRLHGRKAKKFLAFHDTFTCGTRDESGPDPSSPGILPAIEEFMARFPGEYSTAYRTDANNGLWILKRG